MKLSNYVVEFIESQGVTHIFEVCGGALAHLLDSLYGRSNPIVVSMHHEMAAAMAAEGYARVRGTLGVAMATSGPGATNMITGIGSCFFDSVPTLFITGQVNTYEFKFDRPVRQVGFQETDIVEIVRPITKEAVLVTDEDRIRYHLERASHLAMEGRRGPVLLDIPLDIQRAEVDPATLEGFEEAVDGPEPLGEGLVQIIELLREASRPVILAGGGVRIAEAVGDLEELVFRTGIPVVCSLMGLDSFPHDHPCYAGMIGTYGNRYANLAIANCDLLIALGTRLDTRQTGTRPDTFARGARIVHVDIDPFELGSKVKPDLAFNCDISAFLSALNSLEPSVDGGRVSAWREVIDGYKARFPHFPPPRGDGGGEGDGDGIDPNRLMNKLSCYLPEAAIISVDVGQIQMWAAQSLLVRRSQRFLTEGGMACMGSALPMAIGASFARPGAPVVVIAGDGGFQINIQELQTVFHHRLPIKIILINNRCYGMVRQFQEQYFEGRLQSTVVGYSSPDFVNVAKAYGIPAKRVSIESKVEEAFNWLFQDRLPRFLEVAIDQRSLVTPKLSVNRPLEDQDPALPREELRAMMTLEMLE